jgi:hypothetical protein
MIDEQHEPLDTAAARLHALASSLYYVATLNGGVESERHFEALPQVDQQYFESLMREALEAAAFWRLSLDAQPPAPVTPPRPALTLVLKILDDDA